MQAARVLKSWQKRGSRADAASRGAVLFEIWWTFVIDDLAANPALPRDNSDNFYWPHPLFTTPWSANNPLTTPQVWPMRNHGSLI